MAQFLWLMLFVALGLIYFWPTIAAIERRHDAKLPIAFVNTLFGWTLLGWLVALVWAYNGRR